jgi:hypothetical protein
MPAVLANPGVLAVVACTPSQFNKLVVCVVVYVVHACDGPDRAIAPPPRQTSQNARSAIRFLDTAGAEQLRLLAFSEATTTKPVRRLRTRRYTLFIAFFQGDDAGKPSRDGLSTRHGRPKNVKYLDNVHTGK